MSHSESLDVLSNPIEWSVTRYVVELSPDTALPTSIAITLRHQHGDLRTLVFSHPRFEQFGPFQIPDIQHIEVRRTVDRAWESAAGVEVREHLEEQGVLFWASSVEAHA